MMDIVKVGNVSSTSGTGHSGQSDEAALLLKSIVDNKISFQQGRTMGRMCESLRRHARRLAGVDLRDYTDLRPAAHDERARVPAAVPGPATLPHDLVGRAA